MYVAPLKNISADPACMHFSELNPNEVVILFDKGKSLVKADKYPLCSASRMFAQLLDGPFLVGTAITDLSELS